MSAQYGQSKLAAKFGNRLDAVLAKHAGDAPDVGIIQLPPGLNGIARLSRCYLEQYKKGDNTGEYYCRMVGVVTEPYSFTHNGVEGKVAGLQTSQMLAICQTTTKSTGKVTTMEEAVVKLQNELKLLAGSGAASMLTTATGMEVLINQLNALGEAGKGPHFRFTTSSKRDQVTKKLTNEIWENWHGSDGLENYVPPSPASLTSDRGTPTASPAAANEQMTPPVARQEPSSSQTVTAPPLSSSPLTGAAPPKVTPPARRAAAPPTLQPSPPYSSPVPVQTPNRAPPLPDASPASEFDLGDLVGRAGSGDEGAANELKRLAAVVGRSAEECDNAPVWEDVKEWIEAGSSVESEGPGEGGSAEESPGTEKTAPEDTTDGWAPFPDQVYRYQKKGAKSATEYDVISVDEIARTVTLKDLTTDKILMGTNKKPLPVAWGELVR